MIRLYIPEPLSGFHIAIWFTPLPENMPYTANFPPNFFQSGVERVGDPSQADAILLPNNFREELIPVAVAYIKKYVDLGERVGKPVVVFSIGDLTDRVIFDPRVYALRFSLYKHFASSRDISIPNLVDDGAKAGITLRAKHERPLVSFCGLAAVPSTIGRLKYYAKNAWYELLAQSNPSVRARKPGIYWRRASMRACALSPLVESRFIVRDTFSGSRKTIGLDPAKARREFLESIENADFILAPKGDGNFSNRFIEALSLGRIPVLIDTDVVLPLENIIEYEKIVVRVPMNRVHETSRYIRAFYDALTEDEWRARQRLAREIFEKYLRQDSFFRYFFTNVLPRSG